MDLESDLFEASRLVYCRAFDEAERQVQALIGATKSDVEQLGILERHVEHLEKLNADRKTRNAAIRAWIRQKNQVRI
jgi:hypothetical protein